MRRVTGSPWIADFRCWTWPEVAILGADQKERGLWGREWGIESSGWIRFFEYAQSNLIPRTFSLAWGRDAREKPSQGKGPGNEVVRRVSVSYSQPIRFARFDGKSVNRGLPGLDYVRALDPCPMPQARIWRIWSWAQLGTRMESVVLRRWGVLYKIIWFYLDNVNWPP